MKFDLSGLTQTILSAKVRLVVVEGGPDGGSIHPVSNNYQGSTEAWEELGLIWKNAPEIEADDLGSVDAVTSGDIVEFDVSEVVISSAIYSFGLKNSASDPVDYSSKEGNSPPELIVRVPTTPIPIVSSFTPTGGVVGTSVTVTGANFLSASQVSIGGAPAAFTINSDRIVIAQVPAGATSGTISITNTDGVGASPELFTVINPPIIAGFSPIGGPMGTEVTVTGDNLLQMTQVLFNGTLADIFTIDSNSVLRVDVPVGASTGPIILSNIAGSNASTADFVVTEDPVLVSFTPISGVVGTIVTIAGNGLSEVTDVLFAGVSTSELDIDSDAQIRVGVPSGAPSGTISAVHPDGLLESDDLFAVIRHPEITGFSPLNGGVGTEVTITGSNLLGVSDASFAGTATTVFTADSESVLRAEVPPGAVTGRITVSNVVGSDSTDSVFSLISPPTIRSLSPPCGPVDTEVTITGTSFETGVTVTFNGIAASEVAVDSDTEVRARVPSEFSSGEVVVTNVVGSVAAISDFTVQEGCYSFVTTDDGYTRSGEPIQNNGNDHDLKVKSGSGGEGITYLKFNVTGVVGSIQSAKVRLFVQKGSSSGGSIYPVSNNYEGTTDPWDELGLVWLNAPQISGPPLFTLGAVTPDVEVELDVTPAITGNGVFSFAIQNDIGDLAEYSSNNRTTDGSDPLLTIITGGGTVSSEQAVFNPTDDAFVRSTEPDKNYKRSAELRLRKSSTVYNSYLKFNVSGLTGPVQNAVIRLHVIDAGPDGGSIFSVSNIHPASGAQWNEAGLTFNNAPTITGQALSTAGQADLGATMEFNVTPAIIGNGVYSFGISNQSSSTTKYSSKDGVQAPELVITFGSGGGSVSPPLISSFSPPTGATGSNVTISGSDFSEATSVLFNDTASAFNVISDIQIQTTVPVGATTGKISVTTIAGTATSTDDFVVTDANHSGSEIVIFTPTHDSFARGPKPTTIYGGAESIRVRNQDHIGYLKFEVTGLATVFSATLRLQVTDPSLKGGSVYLAENTFRDSSTPWTEGGLIWPNRPNITGEALSTVGVGVVGDTVDFDVSEAITGNGTYSFAIFDASSDAIYYSSKDGPGVPTLVVRANTTAAKLAAEDETEDEETVETVPEVVQLYPTYPSPFNVQTTIRYDLPKEGHVKLFVYNTLGQEVRELVNEIQPAGIKKVRWDGKNNSGYDAASGTYFVRLKVAGKVMSRKIVLQK
ncbi:DNRLRE domain-containing protein [bacterium]|nr:DNRLRE domain-containing protein [bacterium]